jgi:hypothetical protein
MSFNDEGFLTLDLVEWMATTRVQFKEWFDLVDSFNRGAIKILLAIKPSLSKNQELVAASLYRRAIQSFEGAVLMTERGMIADARSLVRSCAETAIAIWGVAIDEKFVDALIEAHQSHRLRHANALLKDPESCQELKPEQVSNLQQVVAEVTRQYQPPRPQSIIWDQVAKRAKIVALYDTIYRMTSGDAAHATVLALDRHVEPDGRGKIGQLTFRPETRDLAQTLSFATNALLHAMVAIARVFPQEEIEGTVKSCMDQWQAMHPEQ